LIVHLQDGAELHVVGFFVGQGSDRFQLHVAVHHEGQGTTGLTNIRGALAGHSFADVTGLIAIPPTGVKTNAFFEARTVLLSRNAKSESLPSLEILANDVKAGHASTMSGLDEESLFYLQSRGLPKEAAARMLIEGLLAAPLRDLPDAERVSILGHLHTAVAELPIDDV
jgi:Fe-S cluster assembly scaffold protein SufB